MRIYVGNLSFNTEEQGLQDLFAAYGPVESVRLIRDQMTGRSRGFGFVEMGDAEGKSACEALDQREFEGRRLTVNEAKPQERRAGGFGGGAGGGGGRKSGGFGRDKREARW
jgi:RNA recognition motif-containing protein